MNIYRSLQQLSWKSRRTRLLVFYISALVARVRYGLSRVENSMRCSLNKNFISTMQTGVIKELLERWMQHGRIGNNSLTQFNFVI